MEEDFFFDEKIISNIIIQNKNSIEFCKKDSLKHFAELDKILELRGLKDE